MDYLKVKETDAKRKDLEKHESNNSINGSINGSREKVINNDNSGRKSNKNGNITVTSFGFDSQEK